MARIPRFERTVLPDRVDLSAIESAGGVARGIASAADVALKFKQAKDATFVAEQSVKFEREVDDLFDRFKENAKDDPDAFKKDFKSEIQKLADSFRKDGSQEAVTEFNKIGDEILFNYTNKYDAFAEKQNIINFENSRVNAVRENAVLARRAGQRGEDLGPILRNGQVISAAATSYLDSSSVARLQDEDARELTIAYLGGLIEENPDEGLRRVEEGEFDNILTANDLQDLKLTADKQIEKNAKKRNKLSVAQIAENEGLLMDSILDPNNQTPVAEQLLDINRQELTGAITDNFAADARRYINSKKEIDAITNTEVMDRMIQQMYDLNSQADVSSEDYLTGVQNLRGEILRQSAEGNLNADDRKKLNGQMRTLMSSKIADATNTIAFNFGAGSDLIDDQLPPEFRGEAIRSLFYATEGNTELTEEEYLIEARKAIDRINATRRDKSLKTVDTLTRPVDASQSNESWIEENGITEDEIQSTLEQFPSLTRDQLINRLRSGGQ